MGGCRRAGGCSPRFAKYFAFFLTGFCGGGIPESCSCLTYFIYLRDAQLLSERFYAFIQSDSKNCDFFRRSSFVRRLFTRFDLKTSLLQWRKTCHSSRPSPQKLNSPNLSVQPPSRFAKAPPLSPDTLSRQCNTPLTCPLCSEGPPRPPQLCGSPAAGPSTLLLPDERIPLPQLSVDR